MIAKRKGVYTIHSIKTGKPLGSYKTLAQAQKRERQIQFFKHRKG